MLIVAAISCTLSAEEPVYFADPNLKAAVEVSLGVTNPNQTDMLSLTFLIAHESAITDLTGLEFAENLQKLELRRNQISDISPLAGVTQLEWLDLSENQISDISALSGLTRLGMLWLQRNMIRDIFPLSELKSLEWLILSGNQITDLSPISQLTNVTILTLSKNRISDVSIFSELTTVDRLYLDGNQISAVSPLSNLTTLRSLYLSENEISDISPLSSLMSLENLSLDDNHISDLSPLTGLTSLQSLNLERNEISDLSSLSGLPELGSLNLRENQITDVSPLSGLITLRFLFLSHNDISDISQLSGLLLLRLLEVAYNPVSDLSPLSGHANLEKLYLWGCPLDTDAYSMYIPLLESYGTIVRLSPPVWRNLMSVSTTGGSVVEPGEGSLWYAEHYPVDVNAVAAIGYAFTHWTGTAVDAGVVADPSVTYTTVIMEADYTLKANFKPGELALCVDSSATNHPSADGSPQHPYEDGSPEHPYDTIQEAIDAAANGEVVLVYPGLYQEEIDFLGKAITVQGVATADGIAVLENPGGIAASFSHGEGPDSVLRNLVIRNNAMGIFVAGSSPTISNLTFVRNGYGVGAYNLAEPDISNCIFWRSTGADLYQCQARHSRVQGPGEGNIDANPLFYHANGGDYHLRSREGRHWSYDDSWTIDIETSPCIDSGDPTVETYDELPPNGGIINMGAYGGTAFASKSN
jgi:Leucine-rich repeat (LRR) protein